MDVSFVNIVVLIAAAQGILLVFLIFHRHARLYANRFLAALLGSYTITLIHLLFQDLAVYEKVPIVFVISGAPLLAFPFHFLYTKYLIGQQRMFQRRDWWHGIPFVMYVVMIVVSPVVWNVDLRAIASSSPESTPVILRLFNWCIILQGYLYIGLSVGVIRNHHAMSKNILSSIERVRFRWLSYITFTGVGAISIFLAEYLLMLNGINLSNYSLSSLLFAIYVYGMGYAGLAKSEVFSEPSVANSLVEISSLKEKRIEGAKYERSGLSPEVAVEYRDKLLSVMEMKRPYLESNLTLSDLAQFCNISSHNLSEVINGQLGMNFYDFINSYRIEQVKRDLADPAKQHLKILAIAFEAGFNSKASFNTLFKEQTGTTPSAYRSQIK